MERKKTGEGPRRDDLSRLRGKIAELEAEVARLKQEKIDLQKTGTVSSLILEAASEIFTYQDTDHRFLWVNKATARCLGFRPDELVGRYCFEIRHQRREPCPGCPVTRAANTGKPQEAEITTKEGRVWFVRGYPVKDDRRKIVGLIEFCQDITEQKEAQEALWESWKRNEEILRARLRLSEFAGVHSLQELLRKALDETELLTGSQIGFIHFLEPDERTLSLQMWSTNTLENMCTAEGMGRHYDIRAAGVWVDCVHERRPVIHNDYEALPHRKGLPPGHAPVLRELVVPVVRGDRIVAILGVGNKPRDYDSRDVETVSLLADLAWDIAERKRDEEALRASLEEKEILLREVHHRVKNNLAAIIGLLNLQRDAAENPPSFLLKELEGRIRSMALVHELLYQSEDLSRIDLQDYFQALIEYLRTTYDPCGLIHVSVDANGLSMNIDTAIPCGLVVNEMVTNALKYAFPEGKPRPGADRCAVAVSISGEGSTFTLVITDNGIGFPAGLDWTTTRTLGLRLVRMLGQHQLGGLIELDGHAGTRFSLRFSSRLRKEEYGRGNHPDR